MRGQLDADNAEVKSYRFLDHDDAYDEFKKIFADQPALVESDHARRAARSRSGWCP